MYKYEERRKNIFTEEGQEMFLKIRDKARDLLNRAGAFKMGNVIEGCTGDTRDMLACVDRLVELGEIKEITNRCCGYISGQDRVFVRCCGYISGQDRIVVKLKEKK